MNAENALYLLCPKCHHTFREPRTADGFFHAPDFEFPCENCGALQSVENGFIEFTGDERPPKKPPTEQLIQKLREGCVVLPKRFSGDTHRDNATGYVDEAATNELMAAAADEIERLRAELSVAAAVSPETNRKPPPGHYPT